MRLCGTVKKGGGKGSRRPPSPHLLPLSSKRGRQPTEARRFTGHLMAGKIKQRLWRSETPPSAGAWCLVRETTGSSKLLPVSVLGTVPWISAATPSCSSFHVPFALQRPENWKPPFSDSFAARVHEERPNSYACAGLRRWSCGGAIFLLRSGLL